MLIYRARPQVIVPEMKACCSSPFFAPAADVSSALFLGMVQLHDAVQHLSGGV